MKPFFHSRIHISTSHCRRTSNIPLLKTPSPPAQRLICVLSANPVAFICVLSANPGAEWGEDLVDSVDCVDQTNLLCKPYKPHHPRLLHHHNKHLMTISIQRNSKYNVMGKHLQFFYLFYKLFIWTPPVGPSKA